MWPVCWTRSCGKAALMKLTCEKKTVSELIPYQILRRRRGGELLDRSDDSFIQRLSARLRSGLRGREGRRDGEEWAPSKLRQSRMSIRPNV